MPLPSLATDRLLLRQRCLDDLPAILALSRDPEVMRFIGDGRLPDPAEQEQRVRAHIDTDFGRGLGYWSLFACERPDDFLGYVVLSPIPESDVIELSYGLRRDVWGRGLAAEGSRAALDFGFRQRGLPEIVALTYPANLQSQRVIAKLGFVPAGIRHAYGQDLLYFRLGRDSYLASA